MAIDTATEACSAALLHDEQVYRRFEMAPRQHARLLLPMLESLLDEADCQRQDIEWIAFGQGPGAFTGVRIAAGIAHGLAQGLGCGLFPVSTLAALAARAQDEATAPVLACLDARMGEVYWGCYEASGNGPHLLGQERVCAPESVTANGLAVEQCIGIGPGWASYGEALPAALGQAPARVLPEVFPDAADMLAIASRRLAAGEPLKTAREAQPVYLRDNVAVPGK
nr:tRNA (adenosine(37)-N6)-threonylcarbamoyltransferase complex dimerization subunit type 1 TsaB [Natronospira proteinivora]